MEQLSRIGVSGAALPLLAVFAKNPGFSLTRDKKDSYPIRAISSRNGLRATEKAVELIKAGRDTLDAVVAGVNIVENDPEDISVGYGGVPNEEGVVELDAAVMHGPRHMAGAVAALRNIKNPSSVAKLVMETTDHVLLVGEGALKFARANGFKEEDLLTEKSRKMWLYWKQTLSDTDDWLPPPEGKIDPKIKRFIDNMHGTIHCAAINEKGEISCTTTTSGLFFKLPGRVGDSPIIGAGLYVDNEVGSCGSTGRGEANLLNLSCMLAVEFMRMGKTPEEAGLEVCRRIVDHTMEKRLLNKDGKPDFNVTFYLLRKDGAHAGASIWSGKSYVLHDGKQNQIYPCAYLFKR
jgi:N4-(beta-N-acetylglucosaminyl)-L-asparaginase